MDLYQNLACAFAGTDDAALAAWLAVAMPQVMPKQAARCEAYWAEATEVQQSDIAIMLGWEYSKLRRPIYDYVARDFSQLVERATQMLDFAE